MKKNNLRIGTTSCRETDCARTMLRTPVMSMWKMSIKRMWHIGKRSVGVVISWVEEGKGEERREWKVVASDFLSLYVTIQGS